MYPEYSPAEVGSLLLHGVVVHVHCSAGHALSRWEAKIRRAGAAEAEAIIERGHSIMHTVTAPLDLGCPRIDIDTTDGYDPPLDMLVSEIGRLHRRGHNP